MRTASRPVPKSPRREAFALDAELAAHEDDWTEDLERFEAAVYHEIKQALYDAPTRDDIDALDRCQSIQDAIDILTFAIERDDRV